jgi:hypothetical protein
MRPQALATPAEALSPCWPLFTPSAPHDLLVTQPAGNSGYDPTSWPPVGLGPLFSLPFSAEVAVVVGAATVLRLGHALLFE